MDEKTLDQRVIECVRTQLGSDIEHVKPEANLIDDLGADSLDLVELIMEVESEFDITIPEEDAEKISTIQDLINAAAVRVGVKA